MYLKEISKEKKRKSLNMTYTKGVGESLLTSLFTFLLISIRQIGRAHV